MTLQDVATSLENYERFLTRVVEYDRVWALRGESGFETCESNEFEECSVLLFWSDAAYARRAAKKDFPEATPESISLFDFLFRWLPGMDEDGVLVGPNYTTDLCGLEVEPADVQGELWSRLSDERRADFEGHLERDE
ncbi:MAG: DUF2750 domain-containing protein [Polyangiaceae bacterium]|nr:DUF2750 domain-containing protein [Polyangiaceae bacterium]MCB9605559.1 DUF2750 domain-containing protein [Polyangiaceae bacterium]